VLDRINGLPFTLANSSAVDFEFNDSRSTAREFLPDVREPRPQLVDRYTSAPFVALDISNAIGHGIWLIVSRRVVRVDKTIPAGASVPWPESIGVFYAIQFHSVHAPQ